MIFILQKMIKIATGSTEGKNSGQRACYKRACQWLFIQIFKYYYYLPSIIK